MPRRCSFPGSNSKRGIGRACPPIAAQHARAELGKFLVDQRRARMMRREPTLLWGETECDGDLEWLERAHHAGGPGLGIGAEAVGPGQAGAQLSHAEPLQPEHRVIEPVIVEMKP